jgi:hypothetical protein
MFLKKIQKSEYNNHECIFLKCCKLQKCKTQFSFLFYSILLFVFKNL